MPTVSIALLIKPQSLFDINEPKKELINYK